MKKLLFIALASILASCGSSETKPEEIIGSYTKSGSTITVTTDTTGVQNTKPVIQAAINSASSGDEVYLPNGIYLLSSSVPTDSSKESNIVLKSGVSLRGQSQSGTILKTTLNDTGSGSGLKKYYVIRGAGVSSLTISNLTITSTWNGAYPTSTSGNSSTHGGPSYCINISGSGSTYSTNITITKVTVEKFLNVGINFGTGVHDSTMLQCHAQNASDIGDGGTGYGFQLAGKANNTLDGSPSYLTPNSINPNLNSTNDNYNNTIDGCTTSGLYIRHSALIQYWAHNNKIINCDFDGARLDAIDLHGEDEYDNQVYNNTVRNVTGGAAVGLGNSGATHDKTGPGNIIRDNTFINCKKGVTVQYGTPRAIIRNNNISGFTGSNGIGIDLGFAPETTVEGNTIHDNTGSSYTGIRLYEDGAMYNSPKGSPSNCTIQNNSITNNTQGSAVIISVQGSGNTFSTNTASGNANNTLP